MGEGILTLVNNERDSTMGPNHRVPRPVYYIPVREEAEHIGWREAVYVSDQAFCLLVGWTAGHLIAEKVETLMAGFLGAAKEAHDEKAEDLTHEDDPRRERWQTGFGYGWTEPVGMSCPRFPGRGWHL